MTPHDSPTRPDPEPSAASGNDAPVTDPAITRNIRSDYEAIVNDLEQAHALAADFQQELRGKSNEVAHMKQLLQKTDEDLANLKLGITSLREERHRLANEVMIAQGTGMKLKRMTEDRDRLKTELEGARKRASGLELALKTALQVSKSAAPPPTPPPPPVAAASASVKAAAGAVSEAVRHLMELIERPEAAPPPAPRPRPAASSPVPARSEEPADTIEISFMP